MAPLSDHLEKILTDVFDGWKQLINQRVNAVLDSPERAKLDEKFNQVLPIIARIPETRYETIKVELAFRALGILSGSGDAQQNKKNGVKMGKELEQVQAEFDRRSADLNKRREAAKGYDEQDQLLVETAQLNRWYAKSAEIAKAKDTEYEAAHAAEFKAAEDRRLATEAAKKNQDLQAWLRDGGTQEGFEAAWPKILEQKHIAAVLAQQKGENAQHIKL